jgi:hypothetical protein
MKTRQQSGFAIIELIIGLVVIGALVAGAVFVLNRRAADNPAAAKDPNAVYWVDDHSGGWKPTDTPGPCPNPILTTSPGNLSQATEVAYSGQYRGTHFKAHGLLSFSRNQSDNIQVVLPFDAWLTGIRKYRDGPSDPQYVIDFQHPCGMAVRYDHLLTLGPEFAAIDAKTPLSEGTQGTPPDKPLGFFKAGTVVATGAGLYDHKKGGGFDFGLYDLRQPNQISKNAQWAAIHGQERGQTFYGLCWIDYLPAADKARAMQILPLATDDRGASDYCSFALGGTTLKYNGGQPVLQHSTPNQARE